MRLVIVGYSYGLQALFDHLEDAKFISVTTENELNYYNRDAIFKA
jgi:hypothetical protein